MQARAAVMSEPHGRWTIETLEVAEPGPQEVLVRVVRAAFARPMCSPAMGSFRSRVRPCTVMKAPAWSSGWAVP